MNRKITISIADAGQRGGQSTVQEVHELLPGRCMSRVGGGGGRAVQGSTWAGKEKKIRRPFRLLMKFKPCVVCVMESHTLAIEGHVQFREISSLFRSSFFLIFLILLFFLKNIFTRSSFYLCFHLFSLPRLFELAVMFHHVMVFSRRRRLFTHGQIQIWAVEFVVLFRRFFFFSFSKGINNNSNNQQPKEWVPNTRERRCSRTSVR